VNNESQPIEDSIRSQLTSIIKDCQDRIFLRYRSSVEERAVTPSINECSSIASLQDSSGLRTAVIAAPEMRCIDPTLSTLQFSSELPEHASNAPESVQVSNSGDNSNTPSLDLSSSLLGPITRTNLPFSDYHSHGGFQSPTDLQQSIPSIENEDHSWTLLEYPFEGPWTGFEPGLEETDDFALHF